MKYRIHPTAFCESPCWFCGREFNSFGCLPMIGERELFMCPDCLAKPSEQLAGEMRDTISLQREELIWMEKFANEIADADPKLWKQILAERDVAHIDAMRHRFGDDYPEVMAADLIDDLPF